MIKIITQLIFILLFLISSTLKAQSFEERIQSLSQKIDSIVLKEKELLKIKVKNIEERYNDNEISYDEALEAKQQAASFHATNIQEKVAIIEDKIHDLVQYKVDNVVQKKDSINDKGFQVVLELGDGIKVKKHPEKKNKRTYSYTVLAFGFNNLMLDGDLNSIENSSFEFGQSHFFELGQNYKTRLFKKSGLFYINYGLSVRYNQLRPKHNQYFVVDGDNTSLATHPIDLKKSKFKNTQLVLPISFELDFSKPKVKDEETIYKRNNSWRLGFGGFAGFNLKSKQILKYTLDDKRVREKTKDGFNVNNFVYGLQAQIGHKDTSFYVKYDMNDLFKNDFVNQKNISFGIRFDL